MSVRLAINSEGTITASTGGYERTYESLGAVQEPEMAHAEVRLGGSIAALTDLDVLPHEIVVIFAHVEHVGHGFVGESYGYVLYRLRKAAPGS